MTDLSSPRMSVRTLSAVALTLGSLGLLGNSAALAAEVDAAIPSTSQLAGCLAIFRALDPILWPT
jgi:hypothetical protein